MSNKILVALVFLFALSSEVKATHYFGNEISCRYIGDSTNISRHYLIRLTSYSDNGNNTLPSTVSIGYTSSCSLGGSLTANLANGYNVNGIPVNSIYDCSSFQIGTLTGKKWVYEVDVILPLDCSDWVFQNQNCCRSVVDNLVNPTGQFFLVKAKLNSFYNNNSPRILNEGGRDFCANSPNSIMYSQNAIEMDGDSLVYSLGQPESGLYPGMTIPWSAGYSTNSPITTSNGMNLNPSTGVMTFQATNAELVALKINIDEYRLDNVIGSWVFIGSVSKDLELSILNNCSNASSDWSFQTTFINPDCGDSTLVIKTSVPVSCTTISTDGSDFIVYDSNNTPLPIRSANGFCSAGFTDSIMINLYFPISKNDSLHIVSKMGSDFNTLINYCGYELPEDDSISMVVNNCSNVGLEEKGFFSSIFPNPSSSIVIIKFHEASLKTIRLINPNGQILKEMDVSEKSFILDLNGLPKGLYLLQVQSKDNMEIARILKN